MSAQVMSVLDSCSDSDNAGAVKNREKRPLQSKRIFLSHTVGKSRSEPIDLTSATPIKSARTRVGMQTPRRFKNRHRRTDSDSRNPFNSSNFRRRRRAIRKDLAGSNYENAIAIDSDNDSDVSVLGLLASSDDEVSEAKFEKQTAVPDEALSDRMVYRRSFKAKSRATSREQSRQLRRVRNKGADFMSPNRSPKRINGRSTDHYSGTRAFETLAIRNPIVENSFRLTPKQGRSKAALCGSIQERLPVNGGANFFPRNDAREGTTLIERGNRGKKSTILSLEQSFCTSSKPFTAQEVGEKSSSVQVGEKMHLMDLDHSEKEHVKGNQAPQAEAPTEHAAPAHPALNNTYATDVHLAPETERCTTAKEDGVENLENGQANALSDSVATSAEAGPLSEERNDTPQMEHPSRFRGPKGIDLSLILQPEIGIANTRTHAADIREQTQLPLDAPRRKSDTPLLATLNFVPKLSRRRGVRPNERLPSWEFAVAADDDKLIFQFQVEVRKSLIPDSGYGLFIKLDKVLEMKEKAKKRWESVNAEFVYDDSSLGLELPMTCASGMQTTLYSKGSFLKEKNRRLYAPATSLGTEAVFADPEKGTEKTIRLQVTGEDLHYTPGNEPIEDGIGFYGLFRMGIDYQPSRMQVFSSSLGSIDLGQYGPFREEDCKEEPKFNIKNFIHSNSPSDWPFDLEEKLFDCLQIVDITDDATGEPHELAKGDVLMYVNEVGHADHLKQNVFVKIGATQSIHYYFQPEEDLKVGQWVELLTGYGAAYESSRERHGYGWKNMVLGLPSDSSCLSARLARGLDDRNDVTCVLNEMTIVKLCESFEFVDDQIFAPLTQLMHSDKKVEKRFDSTLRRIYWLNQRFRERFEFFASQPVADDSEQTLANGDERFPTKKIASTYATKCLKRRWTPSQISPLSNLAVEFSVTEEEYEALEEYCFPLVDVEGESRHGQVLRGRLVKPMDETMWCPIAVYLIRELCAILDMDRACADQTEELCPEAVCKNFLQCAREAAEAVRCPVRVEHLLFESGLSPHYSLPSKMADVLNKLSNDLTASAVSTVPKGYLAAIGEKLEILEDCYLRNGEVDTAAIEESAKKRMDLTRKCLVTPCDDKSTSELACATRFYATDRDLKPHTLWYLVWQVAYVVDVFANVYLAESSYSIDRLCSVMKVDVRVVTDAIKQGIFVHSPRPFLQAKPRLPVKNVKKETSRKKTTNSGKIRRTSTQNSRPSAICIQERPPEEKFLEFPDWAKGWTKKTFQRQSGDSKGGLDHYWYTPENNFKLRSILQIKRFLTCLAATRGDETAAYALFQKRGK